MNPDCQVKLGQSTSLLSGYKADIFTVPFNESKKPALYEEPLEAKDLIDDSTIEWSYPTISLHENVEDLLSSVLQVKLRKTSFEDTPSEGGASARWPSGALVLAGLNDSARQTALKEMSSQLGIDLSKNDQSYVLVRLSRHIRTVIHPCFEKGVFGNPDPEKTIKPETLAALKSLERLGETSTDVSMNGANGYLKFYETYGSHFVSSICVGDTIFQVFAYATKEYKHISDYYHRHPKQLSGYGSQSFRVFTVPRTKDEPYGYTAAIGKISIASGDPEMEKFLKDGKWHDEYANTNSIVAPFYRSDSVNLNASFKKAAAISFELASLEKFAEYYRMLIWRRVFKGAMYAKYANGYGVAPYFSNNCPYDLDAIYKDSDPIDGDGLLSTLATPSVNIWNEKFDLSKIVLQFPELVKTFSVFSSAIQIKTPDSKDKTAIECLGSSSASLLGHIISSGNTGSVPPTLCLADSSFNQIKDRLYCGEFYGGLRIMNTDESKMCVVMNGLLFQEKDGTVAVVCDVRGIPSLSVLTERFTDIEFALAAAEARLNFILSNTSHQAQSLNLMKRFLLWLARIVGSHDKQDDQLAALKARAMYLATVASSKSDAGVPVPYLRYETYKDVVNNIQNVIDTVVQKLTNFQNQIRDRKAEERELDRQSVLNQNIINSGKLLQGYIETQASYQQSMQQMFSSVVKDKEAELDLASKQIDKLNTSLKEQRYAVDDAIVKYQDAVADWQKNETIKAALDIASNIFAIGFAFVTPSSTITALEKLGKTVQKIQKIVNVFNAVIKAYKSIKALPTNPQKVISALKDIGPKGLKIPSSFEWDEMKVNFDASLSQVPEIAAKKSLSAAFSILVLRGKALLQSQGIVQKIAADLSAAKQRMIVHEEQKKRLDGLKVKLDVEPEKLDVAKIDLIGLSGQLLFFQRQMLMTLASTVVIQDRALQYEYLRPPTPIGSFTMLNLQTAILNQSQSINKGLTVQPRPKEQDHPIIYEIHGVKPESITNNQQYSFDITTNKLEFASYNYVRVKNVEVEMGGIASTKSGKYYTELVFDGNPFFDRDFNGKTLKFQTTSRIFTGLHDVNSSSHELLDRPNVVENPVAYLAATGQDPFGDKVSDITPFSKWKISLPKTHSNEEIKFDGDHRGVTVRLIFHIYAQLKESSFSSPVASVMASSSNSTVTKEDVLKKMALLPSVCAGWDAVFCMTAEQVNNQLQKQYEDRLGNKKFTRETGDVSNESQNFQGNFIKTEINFTFDAPKLQFLKNNSDSARLTLPIIKGHYKEFLKRKTAKEWMEWDSVEIKKDDGASVMGDVPLDTIPGSVSTQHNVAVKLHGGSFTIPKFKTTKLDSTATSTALNDYFSKLKDGYEFYNFGTLDFKENSVLKALTPTKFKFSVHGTNNKGDILQLFIITTSKSFHATSLDLVDPIPTEYESSLIINSKIFFQNVLPASLGDGGVGLRFKPIKPTDTESWSSEATAGSVSAHYPETRVSESSFYDRETRLTTYTESYVKVDGNSVNVSLNGMKFQRGDKDSEWKIKMKHDIEKSHDFQYGSRGRISSIYGDKWSAINYETYSLEVTLNLSSKLPLSLSGSGQHQSVQIDSSEADVYLDCTLEPPAGACKSNHRELQKKFFSKLKSSLPAKLIQVFNHQFESVSLFALKNLLFPAKNFIDMKEAHVPGDMVVFGNFTKN